jgi:hypothetical protein
MRKRLLAAFCGAMFIALIGGALHQAQAKASPAFHKGCVNKKSKQLRVISKEASCKRAESAIQIAGKTVVGPSGVAGPAGAKGDSGLQGERGATGVTGAMGADGAEGSQGAMGPQGERGATGPAGAAGPKGDKGDTGDQGERGVAGSNGVTNARTATIASGQSVGPDGVVLGTLTLDRSKNYLVSSGVTAYSSVNGAMQCQLISDNEIDDFAEVSIASRASVSTEHMYAKSGVGNVIVYLGCLTGGTTYQLEAAHLNAIEVSTINGSGHVIFGKSAEPELSMQ